MLAFLLGSIPGVALFFPFVIRRKAMSVESVSTVLGCGAKVFYFENAAFVSVEDFESAVDDLRQSRALLVSSAEEYRKLQFVFDDLLERVLAVGLAGSELAEERAKLKA